MEKTHTLADYVEWVTDVPWWEDTDPNVPDGVGEETFWESYCIASHLHKLEEAKGARPLITRFIRSYPNEVDWTFENFTRCMGDAGLRDDMEAAELAQPSMFKKELGIVRKGAYRDLNYVPGEEPGHGHCDIKSAGAEDGEEAVVKPKFDRNNAENNRFLNYLYDNTTASSKFHSIGRASSNEEVDHMYYDMSKTVYDVARGRSTFRHAFIYGDPGIGKSHDITKAVKHGIDDWAPSKRFPTRPEMKIVHGSVGTSLVALVTFFFENRDNKVIVLDDADGFLLGKNQDILNLIKGIFDNDAHPVSTPVTVLASANNLRRKQRKDQQMNVKESTPLLCNSYYDQLTEKMEESVYSDAVGMANALLGQNDLDIQAMSDEDLAKFEDIPPEFDFKSSVIMISNIDPAVTKVDDAFTSRCEVAGIKLSREGFLYKARQVLPHLDIGKDINVSEQVIDWCKKEAFACLEAVILSGNYDWDKSINVKARLDFRLLQKLTGAWLSRMDDVFMAHGWNEDDVSHWEEGERLIVGEFINYDLRGQLERNF